MALVIKAAANNVEIEVNATDIDAAEQEIIDFLNDGDNSNGDYHTTGYMVEYADGEPAGLVTTPHDFIPEEGETMNIHIQGTDTFEGETTDVDAFIYIYMGD